MQIRLTNGHLDVLQEPTHDDEPAVVVDVPARIVDAWRAARTGYLAAEAELAAYYPGLPPDAWKSDPRPNPYDVDPRA